MSKTEMLIYLSVVAGKFWPLWSGTSSGLATCHELTMQAQKDPCDTGRGYLHMIPFAGLHFQKHLGRIFYLGGRRSEGLKIVSSPLLPVLLVFAIGAAVTAFALL